MARTYVKVSHLAKEIFELTFYNYERINKDGLTPYEIRSKTI